MKLENLPFEVKHFLKNDCTRMFLNYTVPLYAYENNEGKPKNIRAIGTGTLIKVGTRYGILTAHHVVHRIVPKLDLHENSDHVLILLMIVDGEYLKIPGGIITEIEIGTPLIDEFGPDLTFLSIPVGNELGTLKAKKTFWSLNGNLDVLKKYQFNKKTMLCTMGSPGIYQDINQVRPSEIRIDSGTFGYFGTHEFSVMHLVNSLEFIDTSIDYDFNPALPRSFGGVSGGGLWAFRIGPNSDGEREMNNMMFCGVAFYQCDTIDNKTSIRHHFGYSFYRAVLRAVEGVSL